MAKHHKVKIRENKWFGYRPDLFDPRDYKFKYQDIPLPPSVDLRNSCPPVMNQGALGSCTAHGITGALRYMLVTKGGPRDHKLSRLQLYYDERALEGTVQEDAGAEIRDGIKCAAKIGVAHETLWPYTISKFAKKPTASIYKDAAKFLALRYERVDVGEIPVKSALASGYPVVVGFAVFESFDAIGSDGMCPMPAIHKEELLGGHCVYVVGYGQKPGHFTCRNSWGADWGDNGDFYMPFGYLSDNDLCDDFWVIKGCSAIQIGAKKYG